MDFLVMDELYTRKTSNASFSCNDTSQSCVYCDGMASIHSKIRAHREHLEMSMTALAEKCGVSSWQTVQQWERENGTAPKRTRINQVAEALGVTKEYLLDDSKPVSLDQKPEKQKKVLEITRVQHSDKIIQAVINVLEDLDPAGRQRCLDQIIGFASGYATSTNKKGLRKSSA